MKFFQKRYQIILFFFIVVLQFQSAFSQNPFDIQSRLADSLQTELKVKINSDMGQQSDTSLFENPFDVSHIPLKRISLEKKIPKFIDTSENAGSEGKGFIFWLLLFSLLLLVVIINSNRSLFFKLFRAIPNENMLRLIQREQNNGFSGYFIFLFFFFIINAGLFVFLSLNHFKDYKGFRIFLYSLAFVAGIYLIRHLLLFLAKNIFPFKKSASTFSFSILLFNGVMSIFLLPVNAFFAFGPPGMGLPLFILGLIIIIGFYLVRQLRGFFIALGATDFSLFHFFIYFCTCEIAPIFVILNFLTL